MENYYFLMHGNDPAALVSSDGYTILRLKIISPELTPFLGNMDLKKMKLWFQNRIIPKTRADLSSFLLTKGCDSPEQFLLKNLALSLTDWYWLCPVDYQLKWEDVNLFQASGGTIGLHISTSEEKKENERRVYDSNASLTGQMTKFWEIREGIPFMIKCASQYYGQQCANEAFATTFHLMQNRDDTTYVSYKAFPFDGSESKCICPSFVPYGLEFVSAYEVCSSKKKPNSVSEFDFFLAICEEHGLQDIRSFLDYMLLSDFCLTNEDRHFYNFGILRDARTLKFVSPAPLFDTGNSMFFRIAKKKPLSRKELLDISITSFHDREEKMLRHITDRKVVDFDLLPTPEYVYSFYKKYNIPEEKAELLSKNYATKRRMVWDYQEGKTISRYHTL